MNTNSDVEDDAIEVDCKFVVAVDRRHWRRATRGARLREVRFILNGLRDRCARCTDVALGSQLYNEF